MITQAPVTLEGGRPTLFPLWWTPLTTSASVLEPHPSHQARGHTGTSQTHATIRTVAGTSNRLRKSIAVLLITFLHTSFQTASVRYEFYCLEAGSEVSQAFWEKGRGFPSPSCRHTTSRKSGRHWAEQFGTGPTAADRPGQKQRLSV